MGVDFKATFLCNHILAPLYFGIVKLFDLATLQANEMIVMMPLIQFKNRFAGFEVMTLKESDLFKLRQNAVNRGKPDINVFSE